MPRVLTINGTPYNYPLAGENPGWGEDASAWAQAVTDIINTLSGSNDISTTTVNINDNVTVFTNINGAKFQTPGTKAFTLYYVVNRSNGTTAFNEYGRLDGLYTGTDWIMSRNFEGDSGLDLTITSLGQIQYKSSSIGGTYSGTMIFKTTSSAL